VLVTRVSGGPCSPFSVTVAPGSGEPTPSLTTPYSAPDDD
jgi:hypothetical protein